MTALNMPIPSSRRRGRSAASWGRWGAASACRRWRTSFPEQAQTQEIMNMVKVNYKKMCQYCVKCLTVETYPCVASVGRGFGYVSS